MENEIQNAASVYEINSILKKWAGQYDMDMDMLVSAGIGIGVSKGIVETPIVGGNGSAHDYTGRDVYYVESSKYFSEVKDLVIKSIRYRVNTEQND